MNLKNVAEISVTYSHKVKPSERTQIKSSQSAYDILSQYWSDKISFQEEFNVLFLDRSNRVMSVFNLSKGGQSGTVVDAKILFSAALKQRASSIILSHNHPSGNVKPSSADIEITKKLVSAALILDFVILDHIILTQFEYLSFADEGMM